MDHFQNRKQYLVNKVDNKNSASAAALMHIDSKQDTRGMVPSSTLPQSIAEKAEAGGAGPSGDRFFRAISDIEKGQKKQSQIKGITKVIKHDAASSKSGTRYSRAPPSAGAGTQHDLTNST